MTTTEISPAPPPNAKRGSDFALLAREIGHAGLLDRRRGYYILRMTINVLLLAAGGLAFVLLGDSWWQLLTAVFLAVVFTQFAFIGHDAGHRQIFASRRGNNFVGHLHGAVTGISFQWWVAKHNRHHANPNHEDHDPDIDIPALAFNREQSRTKQGLYRWITKYQAFLFFPLLLVEAVMLRMASIQAVLRREVKHPVLEAALLIVPLAGYLTAMFLVLSPLQAVLFILVHQGLMGVYLGCSFAPNHKGMPILTRDEQLDHLRKQVLTSRNISGGRWVDGLLGGLNYQIEHHLFPHMPRVNLRRAQPCRAGLLRQARHFLPPDRPFVFLCPSPAPPARRWSGTTPSAQAGERHIMIVLKGHYDITTSAPDNDIVHTGHDLFSHPDTYQWHGESEPRPDHRVSRENLFSEPVDPNRPAPVSDGQTERPPRDPFRSDTDELS